MSYLQAIILGLVQGIAEFLPISSSGHLKLFEKLLGLPNVETDYILFDVLLHFGTLVAVLIRDGRCSFISVGDSRIYLYRGGSLILLTRDQNRARWIDTQISLGKLPEEARSDKKRNALTAYIGMESFTRADRCSQSFSLGPGDRLALMSDGVFGTLSEKEMTEVMGLPEEQVANTMIKKTLAKRNPYQDNCTVAVVDCSLLEEERKVNDCSGIGRPYGME